MSEQLDNIYYIIKRRRKDKSFSNFFSCASLLYSFSSYLQQQKYQHRKKTDKRQPSLLYLSLFFFSRFISPYFSHLKRKKYYITSSILSFYITFSSFVALVRFHSLPPSTMPNHSTPPSCRIMQSITDCLDLAPLLILVSAHNRKSTPFFFLLHYLSLLLSWYFRTT